MHARLVNSSSGPRLVNIMKEMRNNKSELELRERQTNLNIKDTNDAGLNGSRKWRPRLTDTDDWGVALLKRLSQETMVIFFLWFLLIAVYRVQAIVVNINTNISVPEIIQDSLKK